MRIALVSPYSLTMPGGVQGQVLGLARALRVLGHEARVLGPCDGPPPDIDVVPLGETIRVPFNGSVARIAPFPSSARRTLAALREEAFDVVHLHEPLIPGPTITAVAFASGPIVGTFHAAGGGASPVYRALRPFVRRLARRITIRCAVSEDAWHLAARCLGGRYARTFNGVDVERFDEVAPWPTIGPTILFLSRHDSRKGLEVLLSAVAYLPPDTQLWVAGDGPETSRLMRRTAGNAQVNWLGRISDDERDRRLRGADVLCVPSLYGESFGVVLLEGMAAHIPVVASDIPGYRAVADDGRAAVLVRPGDARALAAVLDRVLGHRSTADAVVAAGEARAHDFSIHRLAERYVSLYELAFRNTPDLRCDRLGTADIDDVWGRTHR